jgi:hypothetical protein
MGKAARPDIGASIAFGKPARQSHHDGDRTGIHSIFCRCERFVDVSFTRDRFRGAWLAFFTAGFVGA